MKTQLEVTHVSTSKVHRIVLFDDRKGHVALGTGTGCFASSNGTTFQRRANPRESYGLAVYDGIAYSVGGTFAISADAGATWRTTKSPFTSGYMFAMFRDSRGAYWLGCDYGAVLTTDRPDKGWTKAPFEARGTVRAFAEIDGKLFFAGDGCGVWDGKKVSVLKGTKKSDDITRITEGPKGGIVLIGDGGIAYRSTDRGKSFKKVKTGVTADLADCAWVAGSLFVVGGDLDGGILLRSDDEGASWKKVPIDSDEELWGIASWGDGAFVCGESGVFTLASPKDPYWKGAKDRFRRRGR